MIPATSTHRPAGASTLGLQQAHNTRVIGLVLGTCTILLFIVSYLVDSRQLFPWPDYPVAHFAEQMANGYNDTATLRVFAAIALTVDWRPTIVITILAIALLAWRRAGWLALLPLIYLGTVPFEYLTKEVIHQPWPDPNAVQQPTLELAQYALLQVPQSICPPALSIFRSQLIAGTCQDGSYLSGGAARAVLLAGVAVWWLLQQRGLGSVRYLLALGPIAYVGAVGVGRVYMRWHWPSDIVAGYLLGGICLCAIWLLAHRAPPAEGEEQATA